MLNVLFFTKNVGTKIEIKHSKMNLKQERIKNGGAESDGGGKRSETPVYA